MKIWNQKLGFKSLIDRFLGSIFVRAMDNGYTYLSIDYYVECLSKGLTNFECGTCKLS